MADSNQQVNKKRDDDDDTNNYNDNDSYLDMNHDDIAASAAAAGPLTASTAPSPPPSAPWDGMLQQPWQQQQQPQQRQEEIQPYHHDNNNMFLLHPPRLGVSAALAAAVAPYAQAILLGAQMVQQQQQQPPKLPPPPVGLPHAPPPQQQPQQAEVESSTSWSTDTWSSTTDDSGSSNGRQTENNKDKSSSCGRNSSSEMAGRRRNRRRQTSNNTLQQHHQEQESDEDNQSSASCDSGRNINRLDMGSSDGYRNEEDDADEEDGELENSTGVEEENDEDGMEETTTNTASSSDDSGEEGGSNGDLYKNDILLVMNGGTGPQAAGGLAGVAHLPRPLQEVTGNADAVAAVGYHNASPTSAHEKGMVYPLGRLLDGHPRNEQFHETIHELAERYKEVKNGFRETAIDVLMRQVQQKGGRFLRKSTDDGSSCSWEVIDDRETRHILQRFFKMSCNKATTSSESREERRRERREARAEDKSKRQQEKQHEEQKKMKKEEEASKSRKRERQNRSTHMVVGLATIDQDSFFTFGKKLSTTCDVESMHIDTAPISMAAANAVATGLKKCKSLHQIKVHFSQNETFDGHLSVLMEGIFENPSVQSLNLDDNGLDAFACEFIGNLFTEKSNNRIARLSMENNAFGDKGAEILSKAILESTTLRYLNLGNNGLTEAGIATLQMATSQSKRLVEVSGLFDVSSLIVPNVPRNHPRPRPSKRAKRVTASHCRRDPLQHQQQQQQRHPLGVAKSSRQISSMIISEDPISSNGQAQQNPNHPHPANNHAIHFCSSSFTSSDDSNQTSRRYNDHQQQHRREFFHSNRESHTTTTSRGIRMTISSNKSNNHHVSNNQNDEKRKKQSAEVTT